MPLKSLIKLLQKISSKKPRPLTILDILPAEIIIYMAQFLPLSSTALFTLSCHTARATLGTRSWIRLWAEDQRQEHIEFLLQLSKDLPPYYVPCYHCRVLHSCKRRHSGRPTPRDPLYGWHITLCQRAETLGEVRKYIHEDFQFRTFQMAMKMHRLGLDHKFWLEHLCNTLTACRIKEKFPYLFKADTRIVDSSLLFRSHRVILMPRGLTIRNLGRYCFDICPHIRLVAGGAQANLPETSDCTMNHQHDPQRCVRKSGIVSCTACPTEYALSLEGCWEFGIAVIITTWMDLGEGQTALDPRWWSHLSNKYTASAAFRKARHPDGSRLVNKAPVRSKHVSIRDAFTQDKSSEFHSIVPLETAERLFRLPRDPFRGDEYLKRSMVFDLHQ
jgi:hypothetical protein